MKIVDPLLGDTCTEVGEWGEENKYLVCIGITAKVRNPFGYVPPDTKYHPSKSHREISNKHCPTRLI